MSSLVPRRSFFFRRLRTWPKNWPKVMQKLFMIYLFNIFLDLQNIQIIHEKHPPSPQHGMVTHRNNTVRYGIFTFWTVQFSLWYFIAAVRTRVLSFFLFRFIRFPEIIQANDSDIQNTNLEQNVQHPYSKCWQPQTSGSRRHDTGS